VVLLAFQLVSLFFQSSGSGPLALGLAGRGDVLRLSRDVDAGARRAHRGVSQLLLDRDIHIAEAFASIRSRIGELIVLSLNVGVRVALGALLLIVPGILLMLRYALAVPVAVLEERGINDSLSRSGALTQGHRGRIFVIYILLFVLLLIGGTLWPVLVGLAAAASSGLKAGQPPPAWMPVVLQFGSFVTQSLLGPIMGIAITLVYYDERVRKEAFDLEHMMRQIDAAVASRAAFGMTIAVRADTPRPHRVAAGGCAARDSRGRWSDLDPGIRHAARRARLRGELGGRRTCADDRRPASGDDPGRRIDAPLRHSGRGDSA